MAAPSSLLDLPDEITSQIINDSIITDQDLQNLRLTCKHLGHYATQNLARYLRKVSILMTADSIDEFSRICASPGLGPLLRYVHVRTDRVDLRKAKTSRRRAWIDRARSEETLRKSNSVERLLFTALDALKQHGNIISLIIADRQWNIEYEEYTILGKRGSLAAASFTFNQLSTTFRALAAAASQSRLQVDEFTVVDFDSQHGVRFLIQNIDDISTVFHELKWLDLDFNSRLGKVSLSSVCHVVRASRKIQSLRLDLHIGTHPPNSLLNDPVINKNDVELCDEVIASINSASLTRLSIHRIVFSEESLIQLLDRHKESLAYLELGNCFLCVGSWSGVMDWIVKNLGGLRELHLSELQKAVEQKSKFFPQKNDIDISANVRGHESIQLRIEELLAKRPALAVAE